ncbi:hypothetical protein ACU5EH_22580 [Aliivibrio salmonicida]|uniref:hypothetical protein n=1 Tax=Aliivibrio salmonicida TaxID=40269 RepID=UPI00406C8829
MIITDPKKRAERNSEKQKLVLDFLKQENYTNIKNLMLLMEYKSVRPLEILLKKMHEKKRHHKTYLYRSSY